MKKIILSIICLVMWGNAFCQTAQTGINTTTPQQALHISGTPSTSIAVGTTGKSVVSPTMRVDGLNQTNNSVHPAAPAISTQPLYATASGDLVIGNRVQIIKQALSGTDLIPNTVLNVPTGTTGAQATIYTQTFTLKQPSLVYFFADISYSFKSATNTSITDGASKMGGLEFSLSGSGVPAGAGPYFAAVQCPFSQKGNNGTGTLGTGTKNNVPNGDFTFNLGKVLKLPVGSYTFNIIICASAGNGAAFNMNYGVGLNDHINITAMAL